MVRIVNIRWAFGGHLAGVCFLMVGNSELRVHCEYYQYVKDININNWWELHMYDGHYQHE